eukprot:GSMAST32.ASY1.ANO1.2539.1 assembled CDS
MLAEVETMAFAKVIYHNNTGIMQDEVLAHRIGLVPIRINPDLFAAVPQVNEFQETEANTLVFKLDVTCTQNDLKAAAMKAGDLKWVPQGSQQSRLVGNNKPELVHDDILLTKLAFGQSIKMEVHAHKGMGKIHAKWSPSATATYRMLPEVIITSPIEGDLAHELIKRDTTGVFALEKDTKAQGGVRAIVSNVRNCTMSRECIRENDELASRIKLSRKSNHFIFSVESSGQIPAREIFLRALHVLKNKALLIRKSLGAMRGEMLVDMEE